MTSLTAFHLQFLSWNLTKQNCNELPSHFAKLHVLTDCMADFVGEQEDHIHYVFHYYRKWFGKSYNNEWQNECRKHPFAHNVKLSTPRTKPNFPSWSTWLTTSGLMTISNKWLPFSKYYIGNSCQGVCFYTALSLGKNHAISCSLPLEHQNKFSSWNFEISLHWLNTSSLIAFRLMPRLVKKKRLSSLRAHSPIGNATVKVDAIKVMSQFGMHHFLD